VVQSEGLIYMVLEYGDIDLARLLAKHEKARREDGAEDLDENFIRLYWQQMLQVSPCFLPSCRQHPALA
jgi:serine/threonine-protein kinase TTK/MPS1